MGVLFYLSPWATGWCLPFFGVERVGLFNKLQRRPRPDSHQPMMLLIRGSRKSATLACPRRFLCPLHPMSPMSLATLRVQR